ncbi:MAG: hypothetical protein EA402_13950 [Planctomycetota bacterium]|nr:MAG: hypothetical protein EA402_13950 [Planctomycetota bacterium]
MAPIAAYPRLSNGDLIAFRLGGNGLGNLLFTWARCRADCERHGWHMIAPTWPSIKPKNLWRNPYDLRGYFGLFQRLPTDIAGLRRVSMLLFRRRSAEGMAPEQADRRIIEYRGMRDFFAPFMDLQPLIARDLWAMTKARHRPAPRPDRQPLITMHIRCGDFQVAQGEAVSQQLNTRLPISWYAEAIQQIRGQLGTEVPVRLCSDGSTDELAPVLALPGINRSTAGSAIHDIWALSQGNLIIASGSTFSSWAIFLGQKPSLWFPGKGREAMHCDGMQWQAEWMPGQDIPDHLLGGLRSAPSAPSAPMGAEEQV